MASSMKVAAVQLHCSSDRSNNLARAATAVHSAAQDGAGVVVLPEMFALLDRPAAMREVAEPLDGPTLAWAQQLAIDTHCSLIAGSFVERDGDDPTKLFNTSIAVGSDGSLLGRYRKMHLFDVDIEGARSKESDTFSPGAEPVVVQIHGLRVGLTICYDLRFPELFRAESLQGADLIVVPSAFTAATGRDHWEPLLRARAIENQLMVIAPGQWGTSPDGIDRHGHSLIIDAWGRVLADAGAEGDTIILAEFDAQLQEDLRQRLPALAHRRLDLGIN